MGAHGTGTGTYDTVSRNGYQYYRFRKRYPGMDKPKEFTAPTKTKLLQKIREFEANGIPGEKNNWLEQEFAEATKDILELLEPTFKPGNYNTLDSTYRCYINTGSLAKLKVKDVTKTVIQQYYIELSKKYSESTVKKVRTLLNIVFTHLIDEDAITSNPCTGIKMPYKGNYASQKKEVSFLSLKESDKFYDTCFAVAETPMPGVKTGDRIYGRSAAMLSLIMYTGLRIGEGYGLQWSHVNFKTKTLSVVQEKERLRGKDGKYHWVIQDVKRPSSRRVIPLSERALACLNDLMNTSPVPISNDAFIFLTSKGKEPSQSRLTMTLRAILDRAGIESKGFGLHDLRHTFGSILLESAWKKNKPIDIKLISELLGHRDISTTYNIYLHILQERKAQTIKLFDD